MPAVSVAHIVERERKTSLLTLFDQFAAQGLSVAAIAQDLGVSRETVRHYLKQNGFEIVGTDTIRKKTP